jgi:hypothetical protein
MSKSMEPSSSRVTVPPEVRWIPRWVGELEAPLFDPGDPAIAREEENLLAVVQAAAQPWRLLETQLTIANMALFHLGAAQAQWSHAWIKAWGGAADGGDRPPLMFDPFAMAAQVSAWAAQWAALARSGPVSIC